MINLFSRRRNRHFGLLLKYWKLVFNDHFVIALFFLFGALAYGYSQWLPQLTDHLWWSQWGLILWFVVGDQLGRLATLLERPDPIFLLPQVTNIDRYLRQAYCYSLVLAELITLVVTVVALPFALTTEHLTTLEVVIIFLVAIITKDNWLFTARKAISMQWGHQRSRTRLEYWVNPALAWLATWLINPFCGLIVALLLDLAMRVVYRQLTLDWRLAVQSEADRMYSVYRFFNLFTDVPSVQGNIKRRRWAQGLINAITKSQHPWSYLYGHGFIRNIEVSGLVVRLTAVGMIVAFFVPLTWLNSLLTLLFIYLVATQLMPFYDQYQFNVFTHLYPVSVMEQAKDFQSLLAKVTLCEMFLITLASLGPHLNWSHFLINFLLGLVETYLLTNFYFKSRINQR